jgi:hypothetical protein
MPPAPSSPSLTIQPVVEERLMTLDPAEGRRPLPDRVPASPGASTGRAGGSVGNIMKRSAAAG